MQKKVVLAEDTLSHLYRDVHPCPYDTGTDQKPFTNISILCFFNPGTDSTSSCLCWSYLPLALWGMDHMEMMVLHHRKGAFVFILQLLLDSQGNQELQLFPHRA